MNHPLWLFLHRDIAAIIAESRTMDILNTLKFPNADKARSGQSARACQNCKKKTSQLPSNSNPKQGAKCRQRALGLLLPVPDDR